MDLYLAGGQLDRGLQHLHMEPLISPQLYLLDMQVNLAGNTVLQVRGLESVML